MDIPIIFEDEKLLVVNKPAGLVVHPDGRTEEKSVTSWVQEKYTDLENVGGVVELDKINVPRWGLVHRIDRETSGVLIIAKDQKTWDFLQAQFEQRKVRKVYQAFVYGVVKDQKGVINLPIGRSRSDFRRWATGEDVRGTLREATTHFTVLNTADKFTFLELEPKTGRTHQLRVHLKSLGHPIVSDRLYASDMQPALGFKRTALHAREVEIKDEKGGTQKFIAPYPDDFLSAFNELKIVAK